jgi:hypothetical protein
MKKNALKDRNVEEVLSDSGSKSPIHVSAKALISRLDSMAKLRSSENVLAAVEKYNENQLKTR